MTSAQLRADKSTFISNVNSFIEKYNDALTKLNALNGDLGNYDDTILKNEIIAGNESIATIINSVISSVSSAKNEAVSKIDADIRLLEQQEAQLRLKAQQDEEEVTA